MVRAVPTSRSHGLTLAAFPQTTKYSPGRRVTYRRQNDGAIHSPIAAVNQFQGKVTQLYRIAPTFCSSMNSAVSVLGWS